MRFYYKIVYLKTKRKKLINNTRTDENVNVSYDHTIHSITCTYLYKYVFLLLKTR